MKHFTGSKEEILKKCEKALSPEIVAEIEKTKKCDHSESFLISILHKVQETFGYLPLDKLEAVAYLMEIPTSKVSGVATFYHYFKLEPSGKYVISICLGTACHVKGADLVAKRLEQELGIKIGETTKDGLFTLDGTRCLGTCALAPVIKIEQTVYPKITPDEIPKILAKYFAEHKKS